MAWVWSLVDVAGTDVRELPPVTLMLLDDGSVSGVSGCDLYGAAHDVEGDALVIRDAAAGDRRCDDQVMELHQSYLSLLPLVDRVRLEDGLLVLRLAESDQALRFEER